MPTRRQALATMAALAMPSGAGAVDATWSPPSVLALPGPVRQIAAGGPTGLLALGTDGDLWAVSLDAAGAQRLGRELDPDTPVAAGHGRVAARRADGTPWIWDASGAASAPGVRLARHAGLLHLAFAVIGIQAPGRVIRLEPGGGARWALSARAEVATLPDATPVQVDLDGRGDGGHVAVLAGPDETRYAHGVLGDAVEATRVLWLERHSLQTMRELTLPPPHVLEDIAPRPVAWQGRQALMTVRSGPEGGQLALVASDPAAPGRLRLAALGAPLGTRHRWMAPTTDGRRLLAVHTPHLGGRLHVYAADGERLVGREVATGLSNHRLGARQLDTGVWLGRWLVLPDQAGTQLIVLDGDQDFRVAARLPVPAPVASSVALAGDLAAFRLADGRVLALRAGA
jgi:hypothetical protein